MAYFKGFKPEFWQFFDEIKENNNREWFTKNKPAMKQMLSHHAWISLLTWGNG